MGNGNSMTYAELAWCSDYAERVIAFYQDTNGGKFPANPDAAECAIRLYNRELIAFKRLYGTTIRPYVETIVQFIGMAAAESEEK